MNSETLRESDSQLAPIRPEILAGKLAAIRNHEYPELLKQITERPRLVELLWFIQAMSLRPGSLVKFAEELLAEFPERLGTPTMRAIGARAYTLQEKATVWQEFPRRCRPGIPSGAIMHSSRPFPTPRPRKWPQWPLRTEASSRLL